MRAVVRYALLMFVQRQEGKMLNAKKAFKVTVVSSCTLYRPFAFLNLSDAFSTRILTFIIIPIFTFAVLRFSSVLDVVC